MGTNYFCPVCELIFSLMDCESGVLPCGCKVSVEDAPRTKIRKHKNGEYVIEVQYKTVEIAGLILAENNHREHSDIPVYPSWINFFDFLNEKLQEVSQKEIIIRACFYTYRRINSGSKWLERCAKCVHWLLGEVDFKDRGSSRLSREDKKCTLHEWCTVDCPDFQMARDRALPMELGGIPIA